MASLSSEIVLEALKRVKPPILGKDLVSLNMVQDLKVEQNEVSMRVLTPPNYPAQKDVENQIRGALLPVGATEIHVEMQSPHSQAPSPGAGPTQTAQAQTAQVAGIPGVQTILAVSSGKGGVGKSTVAVNLAVTMAKQGARVGILDADVYGPNLPTMMGVTESPLIEERETPQGKMEVFLPPVGVLGIKVMSMGFLVSADQPMIWRGPMLHSVVQQFTRQVDWGELDYLVVDMPPGTGDIQLSLAQLVPVTGSVLVTTPQEVSAQDVRKAVRMWERVRVPIVGLVENMSTFKCPSCDEKHEIFGSGAGKQISEKYNIDLIGQLPIELAIRSGGDSGQPVAAQGTSAQGVSAQGVSAQGVSEVAQAFEEMARTVAQKLAKITQSKAMDASQKITIGHFS